MPRRSCRLHRASATCLPWPGGHSACLTRSRTAWPCSTTVPSARITASVMRSPSGGSVLYGLSAVSYAAIPQPSVFTKQHSVTKFRGLSELPPSSRAFSLANGVEPVEAVLCPGQFRVDDRGGGAGSHPLGEQPGRL